MSPKSGISSTEVVSVAASKSPEAVEKEIKRHEDFTRIDKPFGLEQHVFNILWLGTAHICALYSYYLGFYTKSHWKSIPFELLYGYFGGLGITVGCHRYWTHRTFKASTPLQVLLMIMQTISNQYPIYKWSVDHRIHHKYTDTNSDPHNSTRGFWFSHMGWLFLPKHKDLEHKLKTFDVPDLEQDLIVRFQSRWYWTLTAIFNFIVPISLMYYLLELPLVYCVVANYRRYITSLHFTWLVNSVAHIWGDKPYDKSITPTENLLVSVLAVGEGWHNYHHTFPWDYKASEFGWRANLSTVFIDTFAKIGWAWDMKTVSQSMLKNRLRRTGDGSHVDATEKPILQHDDNDNDFDYKTPADVTELMKTMNSPIWGWDDEEIPDDFRKITKILRPQKSD